MKTLSHSLILALILSPFFHFSASGAEREMKVGPVPPPATEPQALDAEAKEHVEAKKKFLEELESEAKTFRMTISAMQDAEAKKLKEQEFRGSRKEKIKKFLDEEKRREEMKKEVDQLKKQPGNLSS